MEAIAIVEMESTLDLNDVKDHPRTSIARFSCSIVYVTRVYYTFIRF